MTHILGEALAGAFAAALLLALFLLLAVVA